MAKYHILALFALTILSQNLSAAAPVPGPEVPLAAGSDVRSAAYGQTAPAAASNGIDHLVVWVDGRRLGSEIYATRVGTDGRPAEPLGRRIAAGTKPRIASAGGDYVLVWETPSGLQSIRLSADGTPMSAPHATGSGEPVALVSNGSTYLLVSRAGPNATESSATVLDRDGVPLRTVARKFAVMAGAGTYGGQYHVVDAGTSIMLRSITQDGVVADQVLQPFAEPSHGQVSAAFAPGAVLVAWSSGRYMVAGYDGHIIKDPTLLSLSPLPFPAVAAGWDGREFAMMMAPSPGTNAEVTVFRFAPDGTLSPPTLTLPKLTSTSRVAFSSSAAAQLIVWSENREFTSDVVALAAPSFGALAAAPPPAATTISFSGEAQGDLQIARGPRGVLTVWDDADRWLRVAASFNGGPPVALQSTPGPDYISWPAVLTGEHVFLVVWRHAALPSPGPDRLLAKRFDFDGKDLDPEPLVLMSEDFTNQALVEIHNHPSPPAIAFDGSAFLVAWIANDELYTIRVGETGPPLGQQEVHVEHDSRFARAFWTGTDYLIGYAVQNICLVIDFCEPSHHLSLSRFDRTGAIVTALPPPWSAYIVGEDADFGATLAQGRMTVVWADRGNIRMVQTTLDGTALVAPRVAVAGSGTVRVPEIIWNGSEYVVAWMERIGDSDAHKVMAARFDAELRPIDSAPFEVSAGPAPALSPSLITTPTGVLIAYSRADAANGDAPRAFMRALARQVVGRTRAVRR